MVEVECDRTDQVAEASRRRRHRRLLDNMTPDEVADVRRRWSASAASRRPGRGVGRRHPGDGAPAYAAAGADLISVGALTHSAPVLDLGLDLRRRDPEG